MSSSTEHPSEPPTNASGANNEGHGQFGDSATSATSDHKDGAKPQPPKPTNRKQIAEYSQAKSKVCDPDFLHNHLRRVPDGSFDQATKDRIQEIVGDIRKVTTNEKPMYTYLASLLTMMSEALYATLSDAQKNSLHKQHPIPDNKLGHLIFVDHHASPPTQFPKEAVGCKVKDKPDLLGVYNVDDFEHDPEHERINGYEDHKVYKGIPHHRIIAIVEAKRLHDTEGREQMTTYAFRHHQARPDHPGVFCLSAQPEYYQVIYSDATGVVSSDQIAWDNLDLLEAYIYSHYLPPDNHFLWDGTIQWVSGDLPTSTPTWKVKVGKEWYIDGELIFVGEAWGRRTTVFSIKDGAKNQVIIKDMFRDDRAMKEEEVLKQVHVKGDIPGVVRMHRCQEVKSGGQVIKCAGQGQRRTKFRLALLDSGSSLLKAKSVNDLLKAVYDALEVHRTLYNERKVLHRDMSVYNILMYPEQKHSCNSNFKKTPTFIGNLLQGKESTESVSPACLVIDFDHAAHLDDTGGDDTMTERTGTPMFIARSVSLGKTLQATGTNTGTQMPLLKGEALKLYMEIHGNKRYNQFNDKDGSCHGGFPPIRSPRYYKPEELPEFKHRAEHDVESIYWTLVYALLSVHPKDDPEETLLSEGSVLAWQSLLTHSIPAFNNFSGGDRRQFFLDRTPQEWNALFFAQMEDVACLLLQISDHVLPEYAMWDGKLQPDHLHEALQRLILQYLVDHRNKDIKLDPDIRRPRPNPYASGEAARKPDLRTDLNKGRTGKSRAKPTGNGANTAGVRSLLKHQGARSGKRTKGTGGGNAGRRNGGTHDDESWVPTARTGTKRKTDELDEPAEGVRKSKRLKALPDVIEEQTDSDELVGSEEQGGGEQIGNGEPGGSEEHTERGEQVVSEELIVNGEHGRSEEHSEQAGSEEHTESGTQEASEELIVNGRSEEHSEQAGSEEHTESGKQGASEELIVNGEHGCSEEHSEQAGSEEHIESGKQGASEELIVNGEHGRSEEHSEQAGSEEHTESSKQEASEELIVNGEHGRSEEHSEQAGSEEHTESSKQEASEELIVNGEHGRSEEHSEQAGSEEHTESGKQGASEEHTEGGRKAGTEEHTENGEQGASEEHIVSGDVIDGEKGGSEQHTASGKQGRSVQPTQTRVEAATNAAADQPSTGVRTRSRSKRKINEPDAPAEEPRRSKRRKANPAMGDSKDVGGSQGATGAAVAGGSRDEPSAGVCTKSRSKRNRHESAGKPVEGTRSSQRIKDAAAKKASEKKEAEPRPTVKKSVRRTRSRA